MYLDKEDVSLYYEVKGAGEPLLLIHGVVVDAGLYDRTSELLAEHFQVITYDRRGNSRSKMKEQKAFSMDDQVEDIRDLLDSLGIESAYIAGCSAGAVVGEYFLEKYPERVRHLIMYEPAMLKFLENEPGLKEWVDKINHLLEQRKFNSAILQFAQHIASFDERSPKKDMEIAFREMGNHEHALACEFPGLAAYDLNLEKMKEQAAKITLAAGEKSGNTVYERAAVQLAQRIGKKAVYYPGYHNLPYDLPVEFAICVIGTLMLNKA